MENNTCPICAEESIVQQNCLIGKENAYMPPVSVMQSERQKHIPGLLVMTG